MLCFTRKVDTATQQHKINLASVIASAMGWTSKKRRTVKAGNAPSVDPTDSKQYQIVVSVRVPSRFPVLVFLENWIKGESKYCLFSLFCSPWELSSESNFCQYGSGLWLSKDNGFIKVIVSMRKATRKAHRIQNRETSKKASSRKLSFSFIFLSRV